MLRGRSEERQTLDRLLAEVRLGQSRTLLLRGQAGVGKTALLDDAVDDAHGLDQASAQTLMFVARRLGAESIALLFGARDPLGVHDLAGLPDLVIGGLSDVDSRALLESVLPGRVDAGVLDRIVAEAR